ncbi:hypothetical protein CIPAW_10G068000 [Carya illinoinensis]|uniref:Uncharacterized protein n=1 Tax=Carya illinoinensis TaxID=32201 RepID=A0A8T1PB87_CARIL|nr:hypothetical protein CIPAW_10G068000 [Carya illinoinensis]KAG6638951.1 hypothetical protein CIPAW_10G068000 [Carya illinoinensis]KAG6638952.1 hypothetical protein CIPAW_10G068000 [Carya illinoinensis]
MNLLGKRRMMMLGCSLTAIGKGIRQKGVVISIHNSDMAKLGLIMSFGNQDQFSCIMFTTFLLQK